MPEEMTTPAQPVQPVQTVPAPPAPSPSKKGSPLLVFLTVLLILVGIADLILWGVVGYSLIRSIQSGGGSAPVESAAIGDAAGSGGASGDTEKQEALRAYIQDVTGILDQESAVVDSYNSVAGPNYTDAATMYAEITERTIPFCQQLDEKATAIVSNDAEISEIHGIYRDYVTKYLNTLGMLRSALENQDTAQAAEANNLIDETNDLAESYQEALRRLAEERGVPLNG